MTQPAPSPQTRHAARRPRLLARAVGRVLRHDLILTAALSVVAAALVLQAAPTWLTVPAMAALALVLPGYALTRGLFTDQVRDVAERTVLTVGLSLCATILSGFLLNALPEGLSAAAWATLLAGVALIGCAVAAVRGMRGHVVSLPYDVGVAEIGGAVLTPAGDASDSPTARGIAPVQVVMLVAAAFLLAGALAIARFGVSAQPHPGFTELWLLPGDGASVSLGVTNHEGSAATYRVVLTVDGRSVKEWASVPLRDSGEWQQSLTVPGSSTTARVVDASLFRPGDQTPYRDTHVTLPPVRATGAPPAPSATPAPTP